MNWLRQTRNLYRPGKLVRRTVSSKSVEDRYTCEIQNPVHPICPGFYGFAKEKSPKRWEKLSEKALVNQDARRYTLAPLIPGKCLLARELGYSLSGGGLNVLSG